MTYDHDELRERLPEYRAGKLSGSEQRKMKSHLEGCEGCRDHVALIHKLKEIGVPDPGELFWKTLPAKIVANHHNNMRWNIPFVCSIRPSPLSVFILLVSLMALFMTHSMDSRRYFYDHLFSDPISGSAIEYSALAYDDLREITERLSIHDTIAGIAEDEYYPHSYHEELVYLSSDEIDTLFNTLKNQHKRGGVK